MKRYFLLIFLAYIGLNTVYNSYVYFSSDKVTGKVIGFERYSKIYRTSKGGTTSEISDSPVVIYSYKNEHWEASRNKWGHINFLEIGDEVTVLVRGNNNVADNLNLNTFFQFWFTMYDFFIAFSLCFVGTIFLEIVSPSKEKMPKTWR